jgi:acetate kinase
MTKEPTGNPENVCILTINGGSSSIRFGLFEVGDPPLSILHGEIDRIGLPHAILRADGLILADPISRTVTVADHAAAVDALMNYIEERVPFGALTALGHTLLRPLWAAWTR